jgi:hypothetical protein
VACPFDAQQFIICLHFDDHILDSAHFNDISRLYVGMKFLTYGIAHVRGGVGVILPDNTIERLGGVIGLLLGECCQGFKLKNWVIVISFHFYFRYMLVAFLDWLWVILLLHLDERVYELDASVLMGSR